MLKPDLRRRHGAALLLAIAFAIGAAPRCDAATWSVATNGNDSSGDGSPGAPWREIRRALTAVQPGDTVSVADGTYRGFTIDGLGSTSAPIVVKAEGRNAEILPTTDRGGQFDPDNIAIWNSTNIVIDGLRSFHATRAAVRIIQSNQVTVKNGTYGDNGVWAILVSHSDDAVVEGCDLYGSREQHGIYFANSGDRPVARGNRIHHNAGSGIRSYGDIDQGGDGLVSGALFEDNVVWGNYGGAALNLNAFQDAVIRNNVIFGNHFSSGIALFLGEGNIGVANVQVLHNTIDVPADGKYALRILGTQGPVTVRHNILANRNTAKGPFSFGSPADAANTDSDTNAIAGGLMVSDDNEVTRKTFADWQGAGHEPASFVSTVDALFADEGHRLRAGSPAIDAAAPPALVADDIEGTPRPQGAGSDLGAWEAVASPGCGDGVVQGGLGEQCDDGNRSGGDCCSSTCQFEAAASDCRSADACIGDGECDGAGTCAAVAPPACGASWAAGSLRIDETTAGAEWLSLAMSGGPALQQSTFSDPLYAGGTSYTLCIHDDAGNLAGRLDIDRAGELCGKAPCWKGVGRPPRGRGFRYRDRGLEADGVGAVKMAGGAAGKPKLSLAAKNDAARGHGSMPTGIAAALAGSAGATVTLVPSDGAQCFAVSLEDVLAGDGTRFEAVR